MLRYTKYEKGSVTLCREAYTRPLSPELFLLQAEACRSERQAELQRLKESADPHLRIVHDLSPGNFYGKWWYVSWKLDKRSGEYEMGFGYWFSSLQELMECPDFYNPYPVAEDEETVPAGFPGKVYYCMCDKSQLPIEERNYGNNQGNG